MYSPSFLVAELYEKQILKICAENIIEKTGVHMYMHVYVGVCVCVFVDMFVSMHVYVHAHMSSCHLFRLQHYTKILINIVILTTEKCS